MKYTSVFIAAGLAVTALMRTNVKTDEAGDLPGKVTAAANADGTNSSTENLLKTILQGYRSYLQQMDDMANGADATAPKPANQNAGPPAAVPEKTTLSTSTTGKTPVLQLGHVQTSGALKEVHLAGYPALPDVPPTSSVTHVTAAQLQENAAENWEQTRIQMYYLEHPGHYSN